MDEEVLCVCVCVCVCVCKLKVGGDGTCLSSFETNQRVSRLSNRDGVCVSPFRLIPFCLKNGHVFHFF